jgi:hypothetical protein
MSSSPKSSCRMAGVDLKAGVGLAPARPPIVFLVNSQHHPSA